MVTQLYSVVASRPTRGQRAAHLSVAKLQPVGWRGFGPRYQEKRARRAPLGGLVDYSSSGTAATAAAAASHIAKYKISTRVDSARLSAARPKKGSQSWFDTWVLRAVQRTQRVCSRHQTTAIAVGLDVCSRLCAHSKSEQQHKIMAGDVWRPGAGQPYDKKKLTAGVHKTNGKKLSTVSVSNGEK